MGCLRLGCAFIMTIIYVALLLALGSFLGALADAYIVNSNIEAIVSALLASPTGFLFQHQWGTIIGAALSCVLGVMMLLSALKPGLESNWLEKYGKPINATVTEIEPKSRSRRAKTKGKSRRELYFTYFVVAEWKDPRTNKLHFFHSGELKTNPEKLFPGCGIRILIDPRDIGRYKMEI